MRMTLHNRGGQVEAMIIQTKDGVHITLDRTFHLRLPVADAKRLAEGILEYCKPLIERMTEIQGEIRTLLDEALKISNDGEETWYNGMAALICDWDDIPDRADVTMQDSVDKM